MSSNLTNDFGELPILVVPQGIDKESVIPIHFFTRPFVYVRQVDRISFEYIQNVDQRTGSIVGGKHDRSFVGTRDFGLAS